MKLNIRNLSYKNIKTLRACSHDARTCRRHTTLQTTLHTADNIQHTTDVTPHAADDTSHIADDTTVHRMMSPTFCSLYMKRSAELNHSTV